MHSRAWGRSTRHGSAGGGRGARRVLRHRHPASDHCPRVPPIIHPRSAKPTGTTITINQTTRPRTPPRWTARTDSDIL
jgi:hypothetical protein